MYGNLWLICENLYYTSQTSERTSRKREAGGPTAEGIPSKLAVSSASHVTCTPNSVRRTEVSATVQCTLTFIQLRSTRESRFRII